MLKNLNKTPHDALPDWTKISGRLSNPEADMLALASAVWGEVNGTATGCNPPNDLREFMRILQERIDNWKPSEYRYDNAVKELILAALEAGYSEGLHNHDP